jgi:hypothetical protein
VFAVNTCEVATPLALVVSVSVAPGVGVPNVPLAPEAGAVKVTVAPLVGVPPVVTVAVSGFVNGWPACALCPLPLVAVIVTVGGGGLLDEYELLLQLVRKVRVEKIKAAIINAETLQ